MGKCYSHLTYEQRVKLEAYLTAGLPHVKIFGLIGCSKSTFYRELKRGQYRHMLSDWTFETRYSAQKAQNNYGENAKSKGPQLKIGNDYALVEYIEDCIVNKKYSPDVVIGRIKQQGLPFKNMISTRTLYNYIDSGDIFSRVTRKSLWMKGQRKHKYDKVKAIRNRKVLARSYRGTAKRDQQARGLRPLGNGYRDRQSGGEK